MIDPKNNDCCPCFFLLGLVALWALCRLSLVFSAGMNAENPEL
ncbi:hypothetical protein [Burkholderia gladioli]|nr:hypothetical protein [Burkholderia gladioli]